MRRQNEYIPIKLEIRDTIAKYFKDGLQQIKQLEDILNQYQQKQQYNQQDQTFPPQEQSLIGNKPYPQEWRNLVWRRIRDIFKDQPIRIFENQTNAGEVKQGELQDCYLLSILSALAERYILIKRIFVADEINQFGIYGIWLNQQGEWKLYIIDDFVPCYNDHTGPIFSRNNLNSVWVMLVEKAYAKMYQSYVAIKDGEVIDAFFDLTGAPCFKLENSTEDLFWDFMNQSKQQGFIMVCYTQDEKVIHKAKMVKKGLVSTHAYAILDIQEIIYQEQAERLIKMRNPWGKFEWRGDWSDYDDRWTPELKSQLKIEDSVEDGTFYINIKDFTSFFEGVASCHIHPEYKFISERYTQPRLMNKFTIKQQTHLYITISQHDLRYYVAEDEYVYSYFRIFFSKCTENGLKFIDGDYRVQRDISFEFELEPGEYLLLVEADWWQNLCREYVVSVYCNELPQIDKLEYDFNCALRNIIKDIVLTQPDKYRRVLVDYNTYGIPDIYRYSGFCFGLLYFVYINDLNDNNMKFTERIQMIQIEKLQIQEPYKHNQSFIMNIYQKQLKIVFYKINTKEPHEMEQIVFKWKSYPALEKIQESDLANQNQLYDDTRFVLEEQLKIKEEKDNKIRFRDMNKYPYSYEEKIALVLDIIFQLFIKNWSYFFVITSLIGLLLTIFICLMKIDTQTLVCYVGIIVCLKRKDISIPKIRFAQCLMGVCITLDIIWIIFIQNNYWYDEIIPKKTKLNLKINIETVILFNLFVKLVNLIQLIRAPARFLKFKKDIVKIMDRWEF